MRVSQIIALASSAVLVAAVPNPRVTVGENDVILYGNGRYMKVRRDEYEELERARNSPTPPPMPCNLNGTLFHGPPSNETTNTTEPTAPLSKRWATNTIIVKNPHQRFLGWDVQMSAVVKGAPTTIYVTSGYEVSNSVSVGVSTTFTLVKDFLESSLEIDYTQSWTSSQAQQFEAEVPSGKYGAFVSNPWTDRQSGNVFRGVIGSEGELSYYQADSFNSKSFSSLAWVDGAIALCTGDTFPLQRCLGEGDL
ncbi:hypothetical protein B0J11DRAFT_539745 [Dendryphion nanum]|uniref:Celp0028 effector like protein n=1 Tax=Dendryphion nanum TaxID=256645 RepID=A0A9P9D9C0_9PLEO|nr:hypothetical protein B0J11DRAFT_539745 [Dendryphion nanum]